MKYAILWKRILNEGVQCPDTPEDGVKWVNAIIRSPIITDCRTFDAFQRENPWSNIGPLSVPFPRFWVEYGVDVDKLRTRLQWGALVQSWDVPDGKQLKFTAVVERKGGVWLAGESVFDLDPNGKTLRRRWRCAPSFHSGLEEVAENVMSAVVYGVCDTLQLLGCKNVGLEPRDNEPKQVARAIKRHGGNPDSYRYHVLVVRPPGAKSNAPAQEIGTMPRHVCRGHFQHYGPASVHGHPDGKDRGLLFGQYAGRFYAPPCYKGKKENGIVEKDYAIAGGVQ